MFIFSLSYCEPVQLRRALAYLGLSCHLSSSPAPHQPGTTLVLLQDFQFYCAVASCGVLFRLSSRSKKLTLKYQWFNIQRLISQSQYLSKVWSFTVLKLHISCYIRGKELGELTPALQPGNASAPIRHAPMLLAAHRPELVTRSDLTARESGKCSFSRGRKIKWRLRATRCVCILWLDVVQMRIDTKRRGVWVGINFINGETIGNHFVSGWILLCYTGRDCDDE